jgi:hypothetical protein
MMKGDGNHGIKIEDEMVVMIALPTNRDSPAFFSLSSILYHTHVLTAHKR